MTEMTALHELTAARTADLVLERSVSPVELVEALLERSQVVEERVRAWETLDGERALAAAREAERALFESRTESLGPLHGVPFGAKDIFDTSGVRTAVGFAPFEERVPERDAESVSRLKRAGAVLLGKLVTTQFAQSPPSKTRNPWDKNRTPGGSSSGSGAAVAAREVPLALGSQTNGSVLRPAAYNGVVGLKPTFGRVSKRGVFPVAWSLDHVGVLARDVEDCGLFLSATTGHDPEDAYSRPAPDLPGSQDLSGSPTLGLVTAAVEKAEPEVADHVYDIARRLEAAGAQVREVDLEEPLDFILSAHQVIMQTEVAEVHSRLLERHPESYDPKLRAYLQTGGLLPGAAYVRAQRLRRRISESVDRCLREVDALLLPTSTDVAPAETKTTGDRSLQTPFSLLGLPAISLPSGLSVDQLPLAIQLVAGRWRDEELLAVSRWCEEQLPPMSAPQP